MTTEFRQTIHDLLYNLPDQKDRALKELMWAELNYNRENTTISTRAWPEGDQALVADDPILLGSAGIPKGNGDFHVIYCRLAGYRTGRRTPLSFTDERRIVNRLLTEHPYSLFIFSDPEQEYWRFVNVKLDRKSDEKQDRTTSETRRIIRRITVGPGERLRTAAERIAMLDVETMQPARRDLPGLSPLAIQERHDEAFDVEKVTQKFFTSYREIFERAEAQIEGITDDEERRLFAQRLFNRLLFIAFLERKGWLTTLDGREDYLQALWEAHLREQRTQNGKANFHRDRLKLLFFSGLNTEHEVNLADRRLGGFLQSRIGQVPYLNGGLFEKDHLDSRSEIEVPDEILAPAIDELIYSFNFTVTESTPFDIEVAVDPEMLGKIFEELVTGRHESGSYYTPKTVVSFMCREALKGYLRTECPQETDDAIGAFVEEQDAGRLANPERVLEALRRVRVCDPACGSGAYLLGMLRELIDLRQMLFATHRLDSPIIYDRKLEIIQHNLYGVDIDPFAVNIARLRLWLSLIVEYDGDTPPPLPNLDFKIEVGDSLTGPAPADTALQPDLFRYQQIQQLFRLKGEYMTAHGPRKQELLGEIEALHARIEEWAHPENGEHDGFDWAVEFAEVFAGPQFSDDTLTGKMAGIVNTTGGQMELPAEQRSGGFDIVVANPPYVRRGLIDSKTKEVFQKLYSDVYWGTADLYVYFYARILQLLRTNGIASIISSNKWLRAAYGKKLRKQLANLSTIEAIVDFGDLPIFAATAYPCVIVFQKRIPEEQHRFLALEVEHIDVVPRLLSEVQVYAWRQPQRSLRPSNWTLVRPRILRLAKDLRNKGTPLADYVGGAFYYGIKTGLNKAFVIDESTRNYLIQLDQKSKDVIKPWLRGRDIKRWVIDWGKRYLILLQNSGDKDAENEWGAAQSLTEARAIFSESYPAIYEYLSQFEDELKARTDQGNFWWELRACDYYSAFGEPKIVYPDIAKRPQFAYNTSGFIGANTTYILPTDSLYLLGVLNSQVVEFFYNQISPKIRGGYLRFIATYMSQVPIPSATIDQQETIEAIVRNLLDAGGDGPNVERWERELNELVYEVYGLTDDEIEIIEETVAG